MYVSVKRLIEQQLTGYRFREDAEGGADGITTIEGPSINLFNFGGVTTRSMFWGFCS